VDAAGLVLGFEDRVDVDAAERARPDIEQALAAEWGRSIRFQARHHGASPKVAVVVAEVTHEAELRASDRRTREDEARRHPVIQKVQDLFGVGIREIKTP
jgi:hypothetical protein